MVQSHINDRQNISWVVDRFEDGSAVLKSGKSEIIVPRSKIAPHIKEGDVVGADFYLLKEETKRRENLARSILEEILKTD